MNQIFLSPSSLLYWPWLTSYVLIGCFLCWHRLNKKKIKDYFNYLFPSQHYKSRTFLDDLSVIGMYIVLISLLGLFFRVTFQIFIRDSSIETLSKVVTTFSTGFFGHLPQDLSSWQMPYPLFVVILALALDLGNYVSHLLMHKNNILWQFHKVHHSAEYLVPTTQHRSHPVELMLKEFFMGLLSGITLGALLTFKLIPLAYVWAYEIWVVYIVYYLTFHFRHTHIPISFGKYLSHVFSSPHMHQIHHSIEPQHLNKNFAIVFSFWDWLFGFLYVPTEDEKFRIGLPEKEEQKKFKGLHRHLLLPFVLSYRSLKK